MKKILINGKNYDWANLTFVIFGVPLVGITAINYSEKQTKVNNYGKGNQPVSRGRQNVTYEGTLTVFFDEAMALSKAAPNGSLLDIPPFTGICIFSGDGVVFTTDELSNIEFTERNFVAKQNDGVLVVDLPFIFAGWKTT